MAFTYGQSLHRWKLMRACGVCYLQCADVLVAAYYLKQPKLSITVKIIYNMQQKTRPDKETIQKLCLILRF